MYVKIVAALIMFASVLSIIHCERGYQDYYKKRVKYGPPKYYGRPNRGYYYNPPEDSYSARKPKVSKRPTNHGAGDDIDNIIKQLSKEDLDKIIEFGDKDTKSPLESQPRNDFKIFVNDFENPSNTYFSQVNDNENKIFKDFIQQFDAHDNYNTVYEEPKPFSINNVKNTRDDDIGLSPPPTDDYKFTFSSFEDNNPNEYTSTGEENKVFNDFVEVTNSKDNKYETVYDSEEPNFIDHSHNPSQPSINYESQPNSYNTYHTSIVALKNEESMLQSQIAYLQSQIKDGVVYTDSNMMPEENLPKPMNLRDEDAETSFTNNVPAYVKADQSNSYKLENFGSLPLMDYHSKKDSVSSYHVPRYTVTSLSQQPSTYSVPSSSYSPSPSYGTHKIPVEAAPPASAAKYQSDAHLKAIKIWSHKSKGTAYTLHHDGSLSLEKPSYGHYGH